MSNANSIDDGLVSRLTQDLIAGGGGALDEYFRAIDSPSPVVRWAPETSTLEERVLRDLQSNWQALPKGPRFPLASGIDPLRMRSVLGYVMLLDLVDGGRDFHYRLYGTAVAERSGFDATGRTVSEIPVNPMTAYFLASYRASIERGEPLFIRHVPPVRVHVVSWDRLILPLDNGEGELSRLLVGNVPGTWSP